MAQPLHRRFITLTRQANGRPVVIGLDHIVAVVDTEPPGAVRIALVNGSWFTVEGTVEELRTRLGH
ncbi:MAG: hypothetical protein GY749_38320 [Desulfobacteraceae bacterium]|nr:hypothetical protein [Desulfobacteraceae bacterium]